MWFLSPPHRFRAAVDHASFEGRRAADRTCADDQRCVGPGATCHIAVTVRRQRAEPVRAGPERRLRQYSTVNTMPNDRSIIPLAPSERRREGAPRMRTDVTWRDIMNCSRASLDTDHRLGVDAGPDRWRRVTTSCSMGCAPRGHTPLRAAGATAPRLAGNVGVRNDHGFRRSPRHASIGASNYLYLPFIPEHVRLRQSKKRHPCRGTCPGDQRLQPPSRSTGCWRPAASMARLVLEF